MRKFPVPAIEPMISEGLLHIRLDWDGAAIRQAGIVPRLLADPARLLRGKMPQQTVEVIPMLFSLCGRAQGVAAALALDAAQGKTGIAPVQQRAVLLEAFQESAWRFLIDLPCRYGLPANVAALAGLRKVCGSALPIVELAGQLEQFLMVDLLGEPIRDWRARAAAGEIWPVHAPQAEVFQKLRDEGDWGETNIPFLVDFGSPQMVEEVLPQLLKEAGFPGAPSWRGEPAETGPLARAGRKCGGTVNARFLARLMELTDLVEALRGNDTLSSTWLRQAQVEEHTGLAWVQTARGLLIHYACLEAGIVADYRIVAPTEWNFHPRGAYVQGLTGKAAESPEAARRAAELLLLALDPCVSAVLSVECLVLS